MKVKKKTEENNKTQTPILKTKMVREIKMKKMLG